MAATKEQSIAMATRTLVGDLVADFVTACQSSVRNKDNSIVWDHLEMEGGGQGHALAPSVGSMVERYARRATSVFGHGGEPSRKLCITSEAISRPGDADGNWPTRQRLHNSLCHMHAEYKCTTGTLLYGGIQANFEGPAAPVETTFCAEEDIHFPSLTVEETLRFAVNSRFSNVISSAEAHKTVVNLARLFGINHVLATRVGNEQIRGVSGGERRRLSLAEALVTCPSNLICYDNPTAGLDSSTALEFVQMLREYANKSHCTIAMSLYQGSDDMVPLFDKVTVINSGHCIYYGDVVAAKSYFEDVGFYCPPTMSITDFLNSMSAEPEARLLRQAAGRWSIPQTPEEFATAFWKSEKGVRRGTQIEEAKNSASAAEKPLGRRKKSRQTYSVPILTQILLCAYRQYRIFITDYNAWIVEAACMAVQSIILGTVFRNLPHESSSLYQLGSVVFYAILVPGLQSMSEFGNTFAQRPLLLKHKRYRFYHPMSYGYGQILSDVVWKVVVIAYNIPMYFLAGLHRTAGHFFIFFLVAYISHLSLSMFFRFIAVVSPTVERAGLPVGIFLTTLVIYTGWYIPPPQMQVWLKWLRAHDQRSWNYCLRMHFIRLSSRGQTYTDVAYQACAIAGSEPGRTVVEGASYLNAYYDFDNSHLWRNVGINAGFFVFFAILVGLAMELFRPPAGLLATVFYRQKVAHTVPSSTSSAENDVEAQGFARSTRKVSSPEEAQSQDGHSFAWKDLHLTLRKDGEERTLLQHIDAEQSRPQLYATPLTHQFAVVLRRTWLWYWREPEYFSAKLWMNSTGCVRPYVYDLPVLLDGPTLGLSMEPRFTTFRDIFVYREKASRSYHCIVFVMSSIVIELPFTLITALIYWLLWYFPAGLQTDPTHAGYALLCYWLFSIFTVSLGYLIAAWMPNLNASLMANGFFFMFVNTFVGTLTAREKTPSGWSWYFNVSPLYYLAEGLTTNSLYGHDIRCTSSEVTVFHVPVNETCISYAGSFLQSATGYLVNPDATGACDYCRYSIGQEYYQQFGYDNNRKYRDIGIFIGLIAFNFTAVIVGTYVTKIYKWKRKAE
ncbi:hypothetical protein N7519_008089 [Penicillium mononematosum]|uniref:uncharacterized protein n=1 Tax=Penicillium mononematosum TaxID=268346 RepID=UPI0025490F72|nr:uncharacterized protein N7519_008089 [Penicillium mononematosum]KAJ6186788.1 hypothetical protein N7519_008089 [Penicillium mononematosum]